MKDRETVLEIGLLVFLLSLLGGAALALAGRGAAGAGHARRHALPPPPPGSISPGRHENIGGAAAR
ncbi:MAG: hypothetical protein M3256_00160 [Actinomycetota bacterium]|nr:hypothetical protein [Actinomycetota bacterium]